MRLGAQSLQSDEGVILVDHQLRTYQTDQGERFVVTFAADAEAPEVWDSPRTGDEGRLLDAEGEFVPYEPPEQKPQRTHWDMLLERRTREELEEVLQIRLDYLRARRGTQDLGTMEPTAGRPQTSEENVATAEELRARPAAASASSKSGAKKSTKAK